MSLHHSCRTPASGDAVASPPPLADKRQVDKGKLPRPLSAPALCATSRAQQWRESANTNQSTAERQQRRGGRATYDRQTPSAQQREAAAAAARMIPRRARRARQPRPPPHWRRVGGVTCPATSAAAVGGPRIISPSLDNIPMLRAHAARDISTKAHGAHPSKRSIASSSILGCVWFPVKVG